MFLPIVEWSRSLDRQVVNDLTAARDHEEHDWLILSHLMHKAA